MIHRRDRFRAQKAVAARVLANPKITVRFNTELRKIEGDKVVRKVRLFDNAAGRSAKRRWPRSSSSSAPIRGPTS